MLSTALFVLVLVALAALAGWIAYRSGTRLRWLVGLGSPVVALVGFKLAIDVGEPCKDSEGSDCYGDLAYAFLAVCLLLAVEIGTIAGTVVGVIRGPRSPKAAG